jgi:predicted transcriptional regulator of viral defense system
MTDRGRVAARDLPDWLLAHGHHWTTTSELAELLGVPTAQIHPIVARWRARRQVFSPTRGAYVAIPPEFRTWAAVPASHFVDAMMSHLGHAYYVGLLSAAELHGAAHQRPQAFQVVTDGRLADRSFGRVRLRFVHVAATADRPTLTRNTPTGTMLVSTPAITVLDLVAHPEHGGGLSNVATVISELVEDGLIDPGELARHGSLYPFSVRQRTGWLLEHAGGDRLDLEPLAVTARGRAEPTPLVASGPRRGRVDPRWNVVVNAEVETDL